MTEDRIIERTPLGYVNMITGAEAIDYGGDVYEIVHHDPSKLGDIIVRQTSVQPEEAGEQ